MSIKISSKNNQAYGEFNGGEIIENKPIGFPQDGGNQHPYSNLFYWAKADAESQSTIPLHPHQGFEIMTFVLKGNIEHYDTKNQSWFKLKAGDVQIIRSGNGISHSERLLDNSSIFQIWFNPDLSKTFKIPATYNDYSEEKFKIENDNGVKTISYNENNFLQMESENVTIYRKFSSNKSLRLDLEDDYVYSLYLISGVGKISNQKIQKDDFIIISDEKELNIDIDEDLDLFLIKSPLSTTHETYYSMYKSRYE